MAHCNIDATAQCHCKFRVGDVGEDLARIFGAWRLKSWAALRRIDNRDLETVVRNSEQRLREWGVPRMPIGEVRPDEEARRHLTELKRG